MRRLSGRVLCNEGWVQGHLEFTDRIVSIVPDAQARGPILLPGFVDLHVHGAKGVDIMAGGNSAETVARAHARHGTTSLLGTTMTAKVRAIETALQGLRGVMDAPAPDAARVLGVHLEGPYISLHKLGAQPAEVLAATLAQVSEFHAMAPIRVLTLAPEVPGHLELIPALTALGIRVQLGHSAGTYEDGVAALRAGAAGFTHLYNGMSSLRHREPGMVGAALAHAEYAELIPDLEHVHPGALLAALRCIPRAYGVTDATAATGMPDGEYALGTQRVYKCLGCVRLATGSLAGSALTMDQALCNFVSLGLDLADASRRLSRFPADFIGATDRGRIEVGAYADLVAVDDNLNVEQVFLEGRPLETGQ